MISHGFRRQGRCSLCIRAYTASSGRCVAARVTRFPISFSSFPLIASFLEYHPDGELAWHLSTQLLRTLRLDSLPLPSGLVRCPLCGPSRPVARDGSQIHLPQSPLPTESLR